MAIVVPAPKDPDDIDWRYVVWCDKVGTNTSGDNGELQGATISNVTWTVPTGITKAGESTASVIIGGITYPISTVAAIFLSGGTDGTSYDIGCKIVTSDGRTIERTMTVVVQTL